MLGEGPPLIYMPRPGFSHIELEWEIPEMRRWYERLSETLTLVRYDARGTGLSDREAEDFSLQGYLEDIDAVTQAASFDRFAFWGVTLTGPVVIAYAVKRPERISDLFLWCTGPRGSEMRSGQAAVLRNLLQTDWQLYTETLAHIMVGWSQPEDSLKFAAFIREGSSQKGMRQALRTFERLDVTDSLPDVRARTLVLHRRGVPWPEVKCARELASGIPGAGLRLLEGASIAPYVGDFESVVEVVTEFLGRPYSPPGRSAPDRATVRTVLFTDLVGHTEMMSRLGDERGRAVLREHERITREVLKAHGGTEVKTMGDGFMASFGSVTKAVECAVALQRAFAERKGEPLSVRVGLNAGEPIEEEGDLFGATVILASRIAAKAEGGEILVADTVRGLCSGKGFLFADRGDFVAKGFEEPVRVYEVSWRNG